MKALLIDDHEPTLRLQGEAFAEAGWDIQTTHDPTQAVDMASTWRPDLVVLDLSMPDQDGLQVLLELRRAHHAHVLVLSGFAAQRLEAVVMELGASAYIEKGMRTSEMLEQAKALLDSPVPPLSGREARDIRLTELL